MDDSISIARCRKAEESRQPKPYLRKGRLRRVRTAKELEALERTNLMDALEATGWRVAGENGAAQLLGMKPTTLSSRMKALGVERKR